MKSPLWILNSTLIFFILGIAIVLFITRPRYPSRTSLSMSHQALPAEVGTPVIDIAAIAEHDPFGTYGQAHIEKAVAEQPIIQPPPLPPALKQSPPLQQKAPEFLPELPVILKGIIASPQEQSNRAIIADKKTKQEQLYKVGDVILDAEIIRIESSKVMLLRSNGQQETLFISLTDAQADPLYQQAEGKFSAAVAIKKTGEYDYTIDPELFVQHVTNLAQVIDALDLTTAFDQGRAFGCRIGSIIPGSLGTLLGLREHDIILAINTTPVATTHQRLAVYQQISNMKSGDTIAVSLQREGQMINMVYTLEASSQKKHSSKAISLPQSPHKTTSNLSQAAPQAIPQATQPQNSAHYDQNAKQTMTDYGGKAALLRPFTW